MSVVQFLLRNSKKTVFLVTGVGVVSGLSNAGMVALIHAALNNRGWPLAVWAWCYLGLCLLTLLGNVASQILLLRLSQGAILDLRLNLSRQILSAPLRRVEEVGPARLLAALTGDANTLSQALFSIPLLCTNIVTLAACLTYIGWLSFPFLSAVVIFMILGVFSYQVPMKKAREHLKVARREMDRLFKHFRALTDGNKELKLHRTRRTEFYEEDLKESAYSLRRYVLRGSSIYIAADSWGRLLYFVLIGLMIFVRPAGVNVEDGALLGYVLVIFYMMGPVGALLSLIPTFSQAQVSLQTLNKLGLSLDPVRREAEDAGPEPAPRWRRLECRGVTHAYRDENDDHHFTLGPVDAVFSPGEVVFLCGGNGSGKSTLAKIITGLYRPDSGELLLDGRPVTEEMLDGYRQLFSAIFSDFYLFERIPGGDDAGADERARSYIEQLELGRVVRVAGGMIQTPGLSQGQRKRVALLTAYMEDRPFYVFDEWAADQDPLFKKIFYTQMLPELKRRGKTVLVISHDDHYFHVADRILKLFAGKIEPPRPQEPRPLVIDAAGEPAAAPA